MTLTHKEMIALNYVNEFGNPENSSTIPYPDFYIGCEFLIEDVSLRQHMNGHYSVEFVTSIGNISLNFIMRQFITCFNNNEPELSLYDIIIRNISNIGYLAATVRGETFTVKERAELIFRELNEKD